MDWLTSAWPLRVILLGAGFLFIGALAWFGRRRRHQASGDAVAAQPDGDDGGSVAVAASPRPAHSEPSFAGPGVAHEPHVHSAHRALPVIDWQALESERSGDDDAGPRLAVHAMRPPTASADDPSLDEASDAQPDAGESPGAHSGGGPAPVFLGEPSIDHWPSDDERRICSLRITPRTGERLAGRVLRQALQGTGFLWGPLGIFHYADEAGRALISAANLARPGQLEPANMDFHRYGGLHLFAVLPGPLPPREHLSLLFSLSSELAERIGGQLQDERGAALTEARRRELLDQFAAEPDAGTAVEPPAA